METVVIPSLWWVQLAVPMIIQAVLSSQTQTHLCTGNITDVLQWVREDGGSRAFIWLPWIQDTPTVQDPTPLPIKHLKIYPVFHIKCLFKTVTFESLFFFFFFFLPCLQHAEVPGPGIKPMPQQQPKPLQWQHEILSPLCHKGTPESLKHYAHSEWSQ